MTETDDLIAGARKGATEISAAGFVGIGEMLNALADAIAVAWDEGYSAGLESAGSYVLVDHSNPYRPIS